MRCFAFIWFLSALLTPLFAEPLQSPEIRLVQTAGTVTLITQKEGAQGSSIPRGMVLEAGDVIKTAPGASADISFDGTTLLHLNEISALRIKRLSAKEIRLSLFYGTLLAKAKFGKGEGEKFAVETSGAVVTVQGTEFVVDQKGSRTGVAVLNEGHVRVTAPLYKKQVLMHFNQETQVQRGLSPENAKVLERYYHHKIEMGQMRQRLKLIHKNWNTLTPRQHARLRAAWIKTHSPSPRRRPHPAAPSKSTKR